MKGNRLPLIDNIVAIPFIHKIVTTGADDRVFDSLMIVGPPLILAIAILGRSIATVALAATYIAVFVGYVVYKGTVG